jgi:hypothetical protein
MSHINGLQQFLSSVNADLEQLLSTANTDIQKLLLTSKADIVSILKIIITDLQGVSTALSPRRGGLQQGGGLPPPTIPTDITIPVPTGIFPYIPYDGYNYLPKRYILSYDGLSSFKDNIFIYFPEYGNQNAITDYTELELPIIYPISSRPIRRSPTTFYEDPTNLSNTYTTNRSLSTGTGSNFYYTLSFSIFGGIGGGACYMDMLSQFNYFQSPEKPQDETRQGAKYRYVLDAIDIINPTTELNSGVTLKLKYRGICPITITITIDDAGGVSIFATFVSPGNLFPGESRYNEFYRLRTEASIFDDILRQNPGFINLLTLVIDKGSKININSGSLARLRSDPVSRFVRINQSTDYILNG